MARGKTRKLGFGLGDFIDIDRMPPGPDAIDSDGNRHRPITLNRFDCSPACAFLVLVLHCIFKIEDDQIGSSLSRPALAIALGFEAGRNNGPTVLRRRFASLVVFRFR